VFGVKINTTSSATDKMQNLSDTWNSNQTFYRVSLKQKRLMKSRENVCFRP